MSKEQIMELVEHTANHLGIISKGSLETLANQVRLETIKEVEDMINKEFKKNLYLYFSNEDFNQIKYSLNKAMFK